MRVAPFEAYLERLRAEATDGAAVAVDYGDLAARAEQALGFSLDNADLGDDGVAALIERLRGMQSLLPTGA
jgi:hypothetical protein